MNTRIIFNTDKKLKAAAQKKARKEGLPLSAVLNLATRAYINNSLNVDIIGAAIEHSRRGRSIPAEEIYRRLNIPK